MVPQIGKGLFRHVRMAHQIVVFPHQLVELEARNLAELIVGVGDAALQIRGGDQALVVWIETFSLGNRLIDSHGLTPEL